jgi:hypothetical protein
MKIYKQNINILPIMEQQTATLRTFSYDKYDAAEANILYIDKDKHISKKRKFAYGNQTYLLTTVVLLSLVIIALTFHLFQKNVDKTPEYQLNLNSIEGFHSYNPISIEHLYNDTITSNNHNNIYEKYKYKYYKLIEVCVPHLRRGLKK